MLGPVPVLSTPFTVTPQVTPEPEIPDWVKVTSYE
jgi:hypothetical protein